MAEKPAEKFHEAREHMKAARASVRNTFEDLLPPGFVEHRRAARRELLLALRSLLDAAIERAGGK
ncbi:MAG: hypothetical protein ACLQCB_19760 [Spirochaetia bacterium]